MRFISKVGLTLALAFGVLGLFGLMLMVTFNLVWLVYISFPLALVGLLLLTIDAIVDIWT